VADDRLINNLVRAINVGLAELKDARSKNLDEIVEIHKERSATRLADLTVQKAIISVLDDLQVAVISEDREEDQKQDAEYFVVLDAIDGTTNFHREIPFYAISLAAGRLHRNEICLGDIDIGIVATISGDYFLAQKNMGATINGVPIKTSRITEFNEAIVRPSSEFRSDDPILDRKFANHLYLGSTAVEMTLLARGAIDIFIETKRRKIFDFAAAYLIVREAGGVITDLQGNELGATQFTKEMRSTLIAGANTNIHQDILKIYEGFRIDITNTAQGLDNVV
jgi:fructose-1,6-bisphosphatase/inositol monophosphatase family enzyme